MIAAILPAMVVIVGYALLGTATTWTELFVVLLGVLASVLVVRPLWGLSGSRFFGVRPQMVAVGTRRFLASSATEHGTVRVRRAPGVGWAVVAIPDAGVSRSRIWAAYAIPVLLEAGLAAVAWTLGPEPWGRPFAYGVILAVLFLNTLLPGISPIPGWMLFRLPAAPPAALEQVTLDASELRAYRATLLGDMAEWRAAVEEAASATRPNMLGFRCALALAEGRYADAAAIAEEHGPRLPESSFIRAGLAQYLVLARCYEREEREPRGLVGPAAVEDAMAEGLSAVAAVRSTDALALYWLARGDMKRALQCALQVRKVVVAPTGAAHVECTLALVHHHRNRPKDAAKALANARALAPDLPRIAVVERWISAPAGTPLGLHSVSEPEFVQE